MKTLLRIQNLLLVGLELGHGLLELRRVGDHGAAAVLLDPLVQLGQELVLLADEVLLAELHGGDQAAANEDRPTTTHAIASGHWRLAGIIPGGASQKTPGHSTGAKRGGSQVVEHLGRISWASSFSGTRRHATHILVLVGHPSSVYDTYIQ